eukprot:TRINITY_DN6456_c0_g1_i9.p2 TRINITY_DN6456_c0_g1~~TRINITY_DN6456_c0_g1_i9.p2  ORF type:complete len:238 (-),score=57.44 TRINITY_DN6456_c0_g1_i9:53-766(-)
MEERFNRQRKDVTGIEEARRLIKASNGISVDLSGLDLEQIPEELYQLNVLHNLNLSANSLKSLPEDFFPFFPKLQSFQINSNQLKELPSSIGSLTRLQELWICDNQLVSLPDQITKLHKLAVLGIDTNQITSLPCELSALPNLFAIFADKNQIQELHSSWADRPWRALMFSSNPIHHVPTEWHRMKGIQFLGVFGIPGIPPTVCEGGTEAVLAYLEEQHQTKKSQDRLGLSINGYFS